MDFRTPLNIVRSEKEISHQDKIVMLGSCFAENIGQELIRNKFNIDLNPFGMLYNPVSVGQSVEALIENKTFGEPDVFFDKGVYQSFFHHGKFASPEKKTFFENINESAVYSSRYLRKATNLIITFGTAYVYRYKKTGQIVSNCHRIPSSEFERFRLTVSEIVSLWKDVITRLRTINPAINILFTVSPIRHLRDGLHDNQLSKSTLLLAIDELKKEYPFADYFPSYEIMLDDLRDYRFYDEDMLHPSPSAIKYIWDRFGEAYFSEQTKATNKEWAKISQALLHRPFDVETEEHKHFLKQTLLKIEGFRHKYPYIYCDGEIRRLKENLL